MSYRLRFIVVLCIAAVLNGAPATGNAPVRIGREIAEHALQKSAKREVRNTVYQWDAATLRPLVKRFGTETLTEVGDDLVIAALEHGDDVISLAARVSPKARRVFAQRVPELLPIARRLGPEILELEAKSPGIARQIHLCFGDQATRQIARTVPAEDLPRLLKYGQSADAPATKKLLLKKYAAEGADLFRRVPPSLVLAGGLSASMLYGAHRVTEPTVAVGEQIRKSPALAKHTASLIIYAGGAMGLLFGVLLFWRFRLMPWHGKRKQSVADSHAKEQSVARAAQADKSPAGAKEVKNKV